MGDIHAYSNKIVKIISVIAGIAFQTKILALNAAAESLVAQAVSVFKLSTDTGASNGKAVSSLTGPKTFRSLAIEHSMIHA
jgi:methyl-accepting chemotaxis protein